MSSIYICSYQCSAQWGDGAIFASNWDINCGIRRLLGDGETWLCDNSTSSCDNRCWWMTVRECLTYTFFRLGTKPNFGKKLNICYVKINNLCFRRYGNRIANGYIHLFTRDNFTSRHTIVFHKLVPYRVKIHWFTYNCLYCF